MKDTRYSGSKKVLIKFGSPKKISYLCKTNREISKNIPEV